MDTMKYNEYGEVQWIQLSTMDTVKYNGYN
jgi:hypothetical protein